MYRILILLLTAFSTISPFASAQCELAKIPAPNANIQGRFGSVIDLSETWAIVGAPLDNSFDFEAGAAYLFQKTSSGWMEFAQLFGDDIENDQGDHFGVSVAISEETIMVGASGDGVGGTVFVFEYDGVVWNQIAELAPADSVFGMAFGGAAALDGTRALIGAPGTVAGTSAGSAYVFEYSGSSWNEAAKLEPSDGDPNDRFGFSVSLSGGLALVGAHANDVNAGAAYVFDQAVGWAEADKLVPLDPMPGKFFGESVALSGQLAVIGAYGDDTLGNNSGAAYVFEGNGSTWTQMTKLDGQDSDHFGWSVAIESDRIAIGAVGDVPGSAYVLREDQNGWTHQTKLVASDGVAGENFGSSLAIEGDTILVGAQTASGPFGSLGAAYVFQMSTFAIPYCFGVGCLCENNDPVFGGCANSVPGHDQNPQGTLLAACGSASVAADDLVLTLSHLPPNKFGLFFMGGGQTQLPFGDGLRCVDTGGVGLFRYNPPQHSGGAGLLALGPGIVARSQSFAMNGHIDAGETWYFQGWYRDPMGPCGAAFNLSNGLAITFEP